MSGTRRRFFHDAAIFGAGLFGLSSQLRAQQTSGARAPSRHTSNAASTNPPAAASPPMLTPDVPDLPHETDGAVKVFRLTAEPVQRKIAPFKTIDAWGYNGTCPGPTIQIQQGDRVRVIFEN